MSTCARKDYSVIHQGRKTEVENFKNYSEMKDLSNLGLSEMTEQEMRDVNGGGFFGFLLDLLDAYTSNNMGFDVSQYRKAERGMCVCDTLGCEYCPSCWDF